MEVIHLEEMDSIKLMNRVDSKFVTTDQMLERILEMADKRYRVLEVDGKTVADYDSLYFDTATLRMYIAHQNGKLTRQKVRTRTYVSSGDTFLEIKRKNNHGRTKKKRIQIPLEYFRNFSAAEGAADYLEKHSWFKADELSPKLSTQFRRITLVNNEKTERLTIDRNLHFHNFVSGIDASLDGAVIIELKQDGLCYSPMREILSELRVKPLRVSKYCIGTALTDPTVIKSRFIEKIRKIEKLTAKKYLER